MGPINHESVPLSTNRHRIPREPGGWHRLHGCLAESKIESSQATKSLETGLNRPVARCTSMRPPDISARDNAVVESEHRN